MLSIKDKYISGFSFLLNLIKHKNDIIWNIGLQQIFYFAIRCDSIFYLCDSIFFDLIHWSDEKQ